MMFQYIVRRVFASIPVLLGILLVTFSLARLIPGDPCRAILGEKATEAVCARFIQERGLDKPILTQFGIYIMRHDPRQLWRFIPSWNARYPPVDRTSSHHI